MEQDNLDSLVAVKAKVRELMNDYADNLAAGNINSYDEYRNVVGIIHGLALAERILLDIASRQIDAD